MLRLILVVSLSVIPVLGQNRNLDEGLQLMFEREEAPYKVWVFFEDKGFLSESSRHRAMVDLEKSLPERVKRRRALRSDLFRRTGQLTHFRDLAVSSDYLHDLRALGAEIRRESRWLNAASILADRATIEAILELPMVRHVKPVARGKHIRPVDERPHDEFMRSLLDYGRSTQQLEQINLIRMHEAGYTGQGVVIGILDSGFKRSHEAFNQPGHEVNVIAEYDFVNDDGNTAPEPGDASTQHNHGTYILGCIAAYKPGDLIGGAPDASVILCKTEDVTDEYPAEEDNYVAGIEFAELNGADMMTASLGYIDWYTQSDLDGQTAVTTIAVNAAIDSGVHFCNAAGNEGHDSNPNTSSLIAPADAFKVITCGAVTSSGTTSSFSSEGPTADGRLKPEILARGSSTSTVSPSSDTSYTSVDGTSLSTPLIAAAVACLIQARPDWTVDEMREAIFQTGSDYVVNREPDPLFVRGYGILNAYGAIQDCNSNGTPDVIDIADGFETDCQPNGVPDSCEIDSGVEQDCNLNGVPDSCDIAPPSLLVTDQFPAVLGWQETGNTGLALNLSDDQETSVTFPFQSAVFSTNSASVANNGGVGFGGGTDLPTSNSSLPNVSAFGGGIALLPLWDDIDADTGNVFVETIGTLPNRIWIVQWDDRPHYSGNTILDGDEVTFQIQIYESPKNGIFAQMLYEDIDFQDPEFDGGASATVGFQKNGGEGFTWSHNQDVLSPATILSLTFDEPPFSSDQNGNGIPDECEAICPGDISHNGSIGLEDLEMVLSSWHSESVPHDLNGDSRFDLLDMVELVRLFGTACP